MDGVRGRRAARATRRARRLRGLARTCSRRSASGIDRLGLFSRDHGPARARGRRAGDHRRQPRAGRRHRRHRRRADAEPRGVLAADHRGGPDARPTRRCSRTRSTTPRAARSRSSSAPSASPRRSPPAHAAGASALCYALRPRGRRAGRRGDRGRRRLADRHGHRRPTATSALLRRPHGGRRRPGSRSCSSAAAHAAARGARVYGELARLRDHQRRPRASGAGTRDGDGVERAMRGALEMAGLEPGDVVASCGPTPPGWRSADEPERRAIERVFGARRGRPHAQDHARRAARRRRRAERRARAAGLAATATRRGPGAGQQRRRSAARTSRSCSPAGGRP